MNKVNFSDSNALSALGQMPGPRFSAAGEFAGTARWPLFHFTYLPA
jgi:hypothetical protein